MNVAGRMLRNEGSDRHKVFTIELFFDLVYVFAITQIAHFLHEDLTWNGALRSAILLLAIWWAWIDTTWVTNWLHPQHVSVRVMLIFVMFGSLIMSASIPEAFDGRALGFAGTFVAIQILRSLFFVWAVRHEEAHRGENFQRIAVWQGLSGVFWISGVLVEGNTREVIWLIAVLIDCAAPAMGFRVPGMGKSSTRDWDVSGSHLAERCQLIIIVALGESVLTIGRTLGDHPIDGKAMTSFISAFVGAVALWWIYFSHFADVAEHAIASSDDPGRFARTAYTYSHLIMLAGIVVTAVADELVIAHPDGEVSTTVAIVVVGGTAMYLFGHMMFKRSITGQIPWTIVSALIALGVIFLLRGALSPIWLGILSLIVVIVMAIINSRIFHKTRLATSDTPV
jgi:low temperature requirement protein LtrA